MCFYPYSVQGAYTHTLHGISDCALETAGVDPLTGDPVPLVNASEAGVTQGTQIERSTRCVLCLSAQTLTFEPSLNGCLVALSDPHALNVFSLEYHSPFGMCNSKWIKLHLSLKHLLLNEQMLERNETLCTREAFIVP